jgi:hypothetical protein
MPILPSGYVILSLVFSVAATSDSGPPSGLGEVDSSRIELSQAHDSDRLLSRTQVDLSHLSQHLYIGKDYRHGVNLSSPGRYSISEEDTFRSEQMHSVDLRSAEPPSPALNTQHAFKGPKESILYLRCRHTSHIRLATKSPPDIPSRSAEYHLHTMHWTVYFVANQHQVLC